MVKINYNSLHAKVYRFFYATGEMPKKNLCPYFWSTVLAFLLLIPFVILAAPFYAIKFFQKEKVYESILERVGIGLLGWVGVFLAFCVVTDIAWIFVSYPADSFLEISAVVGLIIIAAALILTFIIWNNNRIDRLRDLYYREKITKEQFEKQKKLIPISVQVAKPKDWLVVQAIKAWYQQNCPVVEWNR